MRPMRAATIGLLAAFVFGQGRGADGAGSGLSATVRRPTLGLGPAQDDPEVVTLKLGFDLHIANVSRRSIGLPPESSGSAESVPVTIVGVDYQGPDKAWTHLIQGMYVDNGALKYEPCAVLRPGSEGDVRDVRTGFLLLKKQLVSLGKEPTIRLHVVVTCRRSRGSVTAQELTTDAFQVHMPKM